ncbi:CPBP family intramembrane glutamic endopeptidase [Halorhabdus sp. CBA1104]|uniref:CPBP family intramembrane glutamic endopeptidase n=1 Tax=Halorhabdus sp. CBA1104 TaxID=1380432 RepID=UPI001E53CD61|nr:type II CAAX endopeptidase family protein [Halorhabdus sp. CBA1104]
MTEADADTNFERTPSQLADDDRGANRGGITGRVVSVLWNRAEDRPRALWRILGVYVAALVGIFVLPALALAGTELPPSVNGAATSLIGALVGFVLAIAVAKYVDRRLIADYGLAFGPSFLRDFGAGSVAALAGMGVALPASLLAGWATVSEVFSGGVGTNVLPFAAAFGVYTIQWAFTAVWEELVFRGLILTNAVEGLRSRWLSDRGAIVTGVVASSVIFTLGHFPGTLGTFGFRLALGLLLGAAYVWTDSLALPIGLHFLVNFAMNNIYGLSNFLEATETAMLIRPRFTGPAQFVGVYGLVNGAAVLCVAVLTVGYVALRNGDFGSRLSAPYRQRE